MPSILQCLRLSAAVAAVAVSLAPVAQAQEFPFGLEMTLDASRQPGSKRLPTLEIGDAGEAKLDLWCKSGSGQFSIAGNTVVFVPGALQERGCTPAQAEADDALLASLGAAATWSRTGDVVSFQGTPPLRFRINTN
jgi:heat shock protein HslJ